MVTRVAVILLALSVAHRAAAQDEPSPRANDQTRVVEEIVVRGQVQQGVVIGASEPDLVLTESDIAAYGVSSIGELLEAIAAETTSKAGRRNTPPVVLLNGRRISGFREIGRYPVESVSRVEVLSEQVSLSYGFAANQRVINFVLKDDVKIRAIETRAQAPEAGGSTELDLSAQRLTIDGDSRFSVDVSLNDRPAIVETERDIVARAGDDNADRAILGERRQWSIGTSLAVASIADAIATGSGSFARSELSTQLGADGLRQEQLTDVLNAGLALNGPLAPTIWGLTGSHEQARQTSDILGSTDPARRQRVRQRQSTTRLDAVVNTQVTDVFTAPLAFTINVGLAREQQDNQQRDSNGRDNDAFGRDIVEFGVNVDAAGIQPSFLAGELTLSGNAALQKLTAIGTLSSYGATVAWRLNDYVQWSIAYNNDANAPDLAVLSAPLIVLPNARVFDATTGELSAADVVDGGNPQLIADARKTTQLGARLYPLGTADLTLAVDYAITRIDGETRRFDVLTDAFEQAFPERVERSSDNTLLRFDRRPVPTTSTRQRNLQTSLSWTYDIKAKRRRASGPRPKRRLRSGRPGRFRFGLVHNWTLQDELTLGNDGAILDLLNGGATSLLGGTPEHTVDLTAYRWNEGFGSFVSASYRASTTIGTSSPTLAFDNRIVINANLSYEFNYSGKLVARWPMLEETRVVVKVINMLDDPIAVRDDNGQTPLAFQAGLLDPLQRRFGIEIRKRF